MTITFGIRNDRDESVVETYECMYCDGKGCDRCQKTGKQVFKHSQWEMNVANANAGLIFSALAMDYNYCGSMNANAMLKALDSCSADWMVRAPVEEGNVMFCGVDHSRATRYLDKLKEIAVEAARREEPVCWG